jgi:hypothetical protein
MVNEESHVPFLASMTTFRDWRGPLNISLESVFHHV